MTHRFSAAKSVDVDRLVRPICFLTPRRRGEHSTHSDSEYIAMDSSNPKAFLKLDVMAFLIFFIRFHS
ncbi:Unannotated [Lentimonas sp. CC19]|nr:Unannotated [Lentimonas sp. CC10]CAA6697442.1 Unannotated [Lentimonas sp. CC19]CAA7072490.1 Unannotated [Lentimonas sp. CC11]